MNHSFNLIPYTEISPYYFYYLARTSTYNNTQLLINLFWDNLVLTACLFVNLPLFFLTILNVLNNMDHTITHFLPIPSIERHTRARSESPSYFLMSSLYCSICIVCWQLINCQGETLLRFRQQSLEVWLFCSVALLSSQSKLNLDVVLLSGFHASQLGGARL